jgi:hypothetical protein
MRKYSDLCNQNHIYYYLYRDMLCGIYLVPFMWNPYEMLVEFIKSKTNCYFLILRLLY